MQLVQVFLLKWCLSAREHFYLTTVPRYRKDILTSFIILYWNAFFIPRGAFGAGRGGGAGTVTAP